MKPTVRTSGSLAALVAAVLVLLVDPATAKWSDPVRVSGVRDVHREPLVAVDREGDVAIGWTRYDKSMSAGDQEARVEARLRMRINGDWRRGRRVSTLGSQAVVQDVALDDDGDGWVMYTEDYRMYLRRIFRGGRVGDRLELGTGAHRGEIAIDGTGNALVSWAFWDADDFAYARYVHRDGSLSPLETLNRSDGIHGPSPALSHDGETGLVAFGASQWPAAARMTSPGVFEEPETLATVSNAEMVWQVAAFADDSGTATVLFRTGSAYPQSWLYAVRLPADGPASTPWKWGSGHVTNTFRAAMDASGDIRVVWVELELKSIYEGWRHPAFTREIPSGGEPGEATRLTGQTSGVSLAQRRDGTGYVGWVTPRVGALPRIVSVSGDGSLGGPPSPPAV